MRSRKPSIHLTKWYNIMVSAYYTRSVATINWLFPRYSYISHVIHLNTYTLNQLIAQLQKTNLSSSLALCILIRYTANLLREDLMSSNAQALYQYLEKMLRDKDSVGIWYLLPEYRRTLTNRFDRWLHSKQLDRFVSYL